MFIGEDAIIGGVVARVKPVLMVVYVLVKRVNTAVVWDDTCDKL